MMGLGRKSRVFAHPAPCDMRRGFSSLSGLVLTSGHELCEGDVFLFVGRTKKRAKVLWYDGTGLCLLSKRLDRGRFATLWRDAEAKLELSVSELQLFLEGCEVVGRMPLSPPPIDLATASRVAASMFA